MRIGIHTKENGIPRAHKITLNKMIPMGNIAKINPKQWNQMRQSRNMETATMCCSHNNNTKSMKTKLQSPS